MKKFRGTIIALICVGVGMLFLGLTNVHEDVLVQFQIKGRVLDAGTNEPVEGAKVMVLLDQWPTKDAKKLANLFEAYSARWKVREGCEQMGLSQIDGTYKSMGQRQFSRDYVTLFGIKRKPAKPFPEAWIVFQKDGYKTKVEEVSTKTWRRLGSDPNFYNKVGDVYLEKK